MRQEAIYRLAIFMAYMIVVLFALPIFAWCVDRLRGKKSEPFRDTLEIAVVLPFVMVCLFAVSAIGYLIAISL